MPQLDCATFFIIISSIATLYLIGFGLINISSFYYYCNALKLEAKRITFCYAVTICNLLLVRKICFFP